MKLWQKLRRSVKNRQKKTNYSIILVGCDQDLIFDTLHLKEMIIGYTARTPHNDVPYDFLGEIKNLRLKNENTRLLVTVDDISLRKWISINFPNNLYTYISPNAKVSPWAKISSGVVIQSGCFISSRSTISTLVKVNVGCQLHHDSTIGAYSVLAPGVILLGRAQIGEGSYIGSRSVVRQQLLVGKNCIIGMGSVVIKNIPSDTLAYGNPCTVILP